MSAISGTRRSVKELVDGTLRVQIDIDPQFKKSFHDLFPQIDMPCALAPLETDFEKKQPARPKGATPLCSLAARWCKDDLFLRWLGLETEEEAADYIRTCCNIRSRRQLDTENMAAELFNKNIRLPFMNVLKSQGEFSDS